MQEKWFSTDFKQDALILAGDIGGTNTNLAIVGKTGNNFTIIMECVYKSGEVKDLADPVQEVLKIARAKNAALVPTLCCISAAGPVANNYCQLTNCKWAVDGADLKAKTGLETLVINDFLAVGYGIPTLDVDNASQITKLKCTDGTLPAQTGTLKAVVGAGTGLGVGFLAAVDGKYIAYPSEGGHSGFAPFDKETNELTQYLTEKIGTAPGTEPFVSGQGITNIFKFLVEKKNLAMDDLLKQIAAAPDENKPEMISKNAGSHKVCKEIMQLFVKMYGKFAGSLAVIFMSLGGMYLAGGIVTKNEKFFTENNLFMQYFEMNYNPNIRPLLKKIPVYIIKDYSISIYGAANAGFSLMQ